MQEADVRIAKMKFIFVMRIIENNYAGDRIRTCVGTEPADGSKSAFIVSLLRNTAPVT